jgi:mannose-1-phosphate guanylyltransferase
MNTKEESLAHFYSVIPAGGIGSRLWPLSRASAPKFLHDLTGSGQTLLQDTVERLTPLAGPDRIMVVTGGAHEDAVMEQIPGLSSMNLVLEPSPKDSTAAIALAAAILQLRDPEVIIGSFAADHVIGNKDDFLTDVREAIKVASTGKIVTIGITPTEPSVGFGYIKKGDRLPGSKVAREVVRFVEKPELKKAKRYYRSGNYFWNAGMFIAPASLILAVLSETEPELYEKIMQLAQSFGTAEQAEVFKNIWPSLKKIAIDYSVAEPAAEQDLVAVVPAQFSWHDVGDFAAIAELQAAGKSNHLSVLGDVQVISDKSSGILVSETGKLVALIGLEDVIVVDTPDALLVTSKEHAQRVKNLVDSLKNNGHDDVL